MFGDGTTSIYIEEMEGMGRVRTIQKMKQGTQIEKYAGVLMDI